MFDRNNKQVWQAVRAAGAVAMAATAVPGGAAGTRAGTDIINTATIDYIEDGTTQQSVRSNDAMVRVDEIVDVVVDTLDGAASPAAPGSTGRTLSFRVTNIGNGPEAFRLTTDGTLTGDAFDPANLRLALDGNGDGVYDPAFDAAYLPGSNEPTLDPDASVTVFIIGDLPVDLTEGDRGLVALAAASATGTGASGAGFDGQGALGTDVVIGRTGGRASAPGAFVASLMAPELVKSQAIADPQGGTAPMPGATITYTLTARYAGGLVTGAALVRDAIPSGTAYVPGSLALDGRALTDAADGDAGQASAAGIEVALGTLSPGGAAISFQVRVND